jgi:hypothetical protein
MRSKQIAHDPKTIVVVLEKTEALVSRDFLHHSVGKAPPNPIRFGENLGDGGGMAGLALLRNQPH